tara:strand:+ start:328 stop:600 length:273 start_codon:yes stop_codon:yes gene_type:complete
MSKYTPKTIGKLTVHEAQWIDALLRSDLDVTVPFTANQAKEAVVVTPTKKGTRRRITPNSYKMAYVLRKAPQFKMIYRDTKKRPIFVLRS